jgi:predicted ester cyclase
MTKQALTATYHAYIACLNRQNWSALGEVVHDDVDYNGQRVGLAGYRQMLEQDFRAIPDLQFSIDFVVVDPPTIAVRLLFDCTPVGELFGVAVNGRRVQFSENVFYEFSEGKVRRVWSVIDKAAVAAAVA